MASIRINGRNRQFTADPSTPLLWVIREDLKLTGTKYGCGIASCGACTVHVDGKAVRACSLPVSAVMGKSITTIEGLPGGDKNPLVKAWVAEQAPQCGYCQSGQIMQAATLLSANKNPTRDQVKQHMDGNICRCGSYNQIIAAVQRAGREG